MANEPNDTPAADVGRAPGDHSDDSSLRLSSLADITARDQQAPARDVIDIAAGAYSHAPTDAEFGGSPAPLPSTPLLPAPTDAAPEGSGMIFATFGDAGASEASLRDMHPAVADDTAGGQEIRSAGDEPFAEAGFGSRLIDGPITGIPLLARDGGFLNGRAGDEHLGGLEAASPVAIAEARGLHLPTDNLAELAQLLALAIAQNNRNQAVATNSELTSLATLMSNAGAQRTLAPISNDGLSALSYSRPQTRPAQALGPVHADTLPEDDEPMPIPSTWRQPQPREEDHWFRQQMGAAALGLGAGLLIVVPSVLWLSGWLDGAGTGMSRIAAATSEPRIAEVRTVKVQVRSLESTDTADQFVTSSIDTRLVATAVRTPEPSVVEASAAEAREAEARAAEEAQAKESARREAAAREAAQREAAQREEEAKAAALRIAEAKAAEAKAAQQRVAEARAAEARAAEARQAEARAAEARQAEMRIAEAKATEARAQAHKLAEARTRQDTMLTRARQRVDTGDVNGARDILGAGDESAPGPVLFALAETYDPNMLAAWGSRGVTADVARARALYHKALGLGVSTAQARLDALR